MIRNELISETAVTAAEQPDTENKSNAFDDIVTEYRFGKATYTVRLHFNINAKRSLKDIVGDMICRDLDKSA